MRYKIISISLITLLLIFSSFLFLKNKAIKSESLKSLDTINDLSVREELLKDNIVIGIESNQNIIKDHPLEINGKAETLSKYMKSGKKLILYSGLEYCSSCVEKELKRLEIASEKIGKENVLVLFKDISPRDAFVLKKTRNIPYNIGSLQGHPIGIVAESKNLPFMFVLNTDLSVSDVFFPYKNMDNINEYYIKLIVKKLLNNI